MRPLVAYRYHLRALVTTTGGAPMAVPGKPLFSWSFVLSLNNSYEEGGDVEFHPSIESQQLSRIQVEYPLFQTMQTSFLLALWSTFI